MLFDVCSNHEKLGMLVWVVAPSGVVRTFSKLLIRVLVFYRFVVSGYLEESELEPDTTLGWQSRSWGAFICDEF